MSIAPGETLLTRIRCTANSAASALVIDRHMRRVEELTERDLRDARHRNKFWLAFQARDVAAAL
jgi:hypothetical protein